MMRAKPYIGDGDIGACNNERVAMAIGDGDESDDLTINRRSESDAFTTCDSDADDESYISV